MFVARFLKPIAHANAQVGQAGVLIAKIKVVEVFECDHDPPVRVDILAE